MFWINQIIYNTPKYGTIHRRTYCDGQMSIRLSISKNKFVTAEMFLTIEPSSNTSPAQ